MWELLDKQESVEVDTIAFFLFAHFTIERFMIPQRLQGDQYILPALCLTELKW